MESKKVSTGHAAELCGVKRDTVFKWVKKGKIKANRTAGGHFRVDLDSLEPYLTKDPSELIKKQHKLIKFCWEYHSKDGHIKEDCRKCMVFMAKAEKCYLMAGFGDKSDHPGVHCKSSCFECEFFKFLDKPLMNVLIVSENTDMCNQLKSEVSDNIIMKFSSCGYETATIVQTFQPDFIVIDDTLVSSKPDDLCRHLINDPRVHGAQIVLALDKPVKAEDLMDGICATIHTPFSPVELEMCFSKLKLNLYGVDN